MLPQKGVTMKPRPIRLCGACYQESPSHLSEWQFKDKMKCDPLCGKPYPAYRHQMRLLTKCTNCETPFPIPADWGTRGMSTLFFTFCDNGEASTALLKFAAQIL